MNKLLTIFAMLVAIASYAQETEHKNGSSAACCNQCDSINMPVYIVDGVEVREINDIASDDIVKVEIIKDPAITKIFSPRLGGIVLITTKSKKFLTSYTGRLQQTIRGTKATAHTGRTSH